jgi:hypothetical protein
MGRRKTAARFRESFSQKVRTERQVRLPGAAAARGGRPGRGFRFHDCRLPGQSHGAAIRYRRARDGVFPVPENFHKIPDRDGPEADPDGPGFTRKGVRIRLRGRRLRVPPSKSAGAQACGRRSRQTVSRGGDPPGPRAHGHGRKRRIPRYAAVVVHVGGHRKTAGRDTGRHLPYGRRTLQHQFHAATR